MKKEKNTLPTNIQKDENQRLDIRSGKAEKMSKSSSEKMKNGNDAKGSKARSKRKKISFLTTFVCIFVGVAIIFGAAMGIMIGVRNARAVAIYEGVTMDEGVANFFASRYKIEYIGTLRDRGIDAYDTEAFFSSKADDGKSYGEHFLSEFRQYLAWIMAANRIYAKYSTLDSDDRSCIAESIKATVKYRAGGSEDKFNEIAEKYGFDYNDFVTATEMLYKAEYAQLILYGKGGENLKNYSDLTEEYLEQYTHVSLAFVSTDTYIYQDPDTGISERVPLTPEARAEREVHIAEVVELINNKKAQNGGPEISEQTIKDLQSRYDSDKDMNAIGYYFKPGAEKTAEFSEKFAAVIDKAYEMQIGEYEKVDLAVPSDDGDGYDFVGVCFIYKSECSPLAYRNTDNVFFSDFYSDASDYFYDKTLSELAGEVEFTRVYDDFVRPLSIPQNYELFITKWVAAS